jgi:DNA polymerase-4/DNA polymerase V
MDGDSFFVAVEVAKNPKLRGLPVVTGQDRGIVTAASYEAKALGIPRGMPIFRVKKDFPKVIVLPGDYPSYVKYSGLMFDIVRRYADDVEEYSIDECFADLTGLDKPLKMSYREIAEQIKREINKELDLSISIGVAPTKVLAKVASKWKKPNGLTVIHESEIQKFLKEVPIEKIWGIGRQTSLFLKKKGIKTALDFAERKREWVMENLSKPYVVIWNELHGLPVLEVDPVPKTLYSSIQKTGTFRPPTSNKTFLFSELSGHMEDACAKARYYNLVPHGLSFFLKTQDFRYASRSIDLPLPTNAPEILLQAVRKEFDKMNFKDFIYRATGVRLHGLTPFSTSQEDLFGDRNRSGKFEEIHKSIDKLEGKYGKKLVRLASTNKFKDEGEDMEDMDRNLLFL